MKEILVKCPIHNESLVALIACKAFCIYYKKCTGDMNAHNKT